MKKIISGIAVFVVLSQTLIVSAADTTTIDNCRQYAYGYMSDGKVYMMLASKKYGPFEDVNQLKFTLERM
jgi:transketolase C-terminal domain/subunit